MFQWLQAQWRVVVIATLAVVMTLGLVAGGALAQAPPTTPTPTTPGTQTPARPAPSVAVTDFFTKLAGKLGLAPDRVIGAAKEVQKEQIDAEVAAGRLTAEQAARLKERVDAGDIMIGRGPGGPGGPKGHGRGGVGADMTALATWLGITPEQLHTELHEGTGKSLAQVAQAHNKTRDALITFLTDQTKARLDQAVAAGRLTQQQADQMLEQFRQNVGQMVDRVHAPGQPGQPGQPRGPRGPRQAPPATPGTGTGGA
jgi:hypothetical protein